MRRLREDPDVAFVVPDRTVRAFGAVPLASGDSAPSGVRRIHAATATTTREAGDSAVAVVDTGIDLSHRDLNAADGKNCVTPGAPAQDDNGHGTHVAGTVGARNDGAGVVGVAPGTKVYAVKVLDAAGNGTFSQIICGLDWVTANSSALNVKVANLSLGGAGSNDNNCGNTVADPLHQAVCRSTQAGVSVVAAAGNSGWDIGDSPPDVPAVYPEVLTVSAMSDSDGKGGGAGPAPSCRTGESDDSVARFSNYATRPADAAHMVAAPGVCIRSTWPGGGYSTISGTSMASPHVAGAVALCLGEGGARGPCAGKSPMQIIDHMRGDAEAHATADSTYGFAGDPLRKNQWGDYFGHLARTTQDTTPPETQIAAGPAGATRSTAADFGFTSTERGSTFACRLDDGPWQACSSPRSLSSLADGQHTFAVRATDAAGNTDASAATRTWTVDTQAPDTSIASGSAGLTNDPTPTFGLAATEANIRFECRVDAGPWASCASPHTTQALADGGHAFDVRATDAAGNVDPTPASRSVTVDATPPASAITSGPDGLTKNTTPTFEFSASEPDARLECRVDAEPWASCSSPHRTAALADGDHAFEVRAADAAGNVDPTPARRSFTVDPAATALLPPRASSGDATAVGVTSATLAGVVTRTGRRRPTTSSTGRRPPTAHRPAVRTRARAPTTAPCPPRSPACGQRRPTTTAWWPPTRRARGPGRTAPSRRRPSRPRSRRLLLRRRLRRRRLPHPAPRPLRPPTRPTGPPRA